ncbi:hypothetical protein CHLRE_03g143927v5 [Chlamydomonas reinhardtii]|uniref:Uncharacterized protein n=1 Tax=Chlamydomonas reinhardtii TaxID=3055 RepID=A0A2K3DV44_CHLRE|nr:uncharacterized protein CHLRE_03g143927v5 [Chlamydomonas reinhardtii]PNW84384.1 hypothetical protein CHLRE_03g143927v5 [Chlamydomonas reinhardtii]
MSNRGRGRGNGSAYRSYDDYDDSYASPGPRSGRSGGGGRGYRGIGGDSSYFLQYGNAGPHGGPHGGLHGGPHGGPYGGPPGRGPPRAPYTAPQYQLVYVEQQQQQQQQQLQQPPQPHPHYRAYPYQYRQQQQQHSSGRNSYEGNRIYSAGGGAISGRSRPQFTPPPVVAAAAASAAASVGGGAIMPVGDRTPRPATLPRAPLTTSAGSGTGSVTPRQSTAAAAAAAAIDPDAPNNTSFMTPVFPQPPRTRTDSCSAWALMVEASCQQLEAVVGPFLEGALMELFGESWERELFGLDLTLPPFSAAACAALVAKCKQLHEKLPITIHKRVEAVAQATESLKSSPGSLAPEDVTAAHTAMRGMLHDCIKAAKMPSLLGAGSRQWRAFCLELLPHAESALLYYDMLLADCTDAATARQHVRAASAAEEGGAAALPAPAAAATAAATP